MMALMEQFLRVAGAAQPQAAIWQLLAQDKALVARSQTLLDQILARPTPTATSDLGAATADGGLVMTPERLWCLVAALASTIAQQLAQQASDRKAVLAQGQRKRNEDEVEDDDEDDEDTHEAEAAVAAARAVRGSTSWHLVEVLAATNVGLGTFLQYFTSLFDRLLLDPELLEVATQLKEDFTIATVLFEKYKGFWQQELAQNAAMTTTTQQRELDRRLHDAGWLVFILAKRRLAARFAGLGQLYCLLLAVLHVVFCMRAKLWRSPSVETEVAATLSALGAASAKASSSDASVIVATQVLTKLCSQPKVEEQDVLKAVTQVEALVEQLCQEGVLEAASTSANGHQHYAMESSHSPKEVSVWTSSVLEANIKRLSELYRAQEVAMCGCLDERFYLDEEVRQKIIKTTASPTSQPPTPADGRGTPAAPPQRIPISVNNRLGSPPLTPRRRESRNGPGTPGPPPSPFTTHSWQWNGSSPSPSINLSRTPTRSYLAHAGAQSPFVMQTPVTAAVETSNWVRDTLSSANAFVTPQLRMFFKECTHDPTEHIAQILQELSLKLLSSRRQLNPGLALPAMGDGAAQASGKNEENSAPGAGEEYSEVDGSLKKTKNFGVALFYRVLESLLISERNRLHSSNFSSLLNNETFISSLFACSLEVVLKAHSLITLSFPFLLDTVGVNAFDFGKIIESFVKHVPKLPTTLKRHMRDLEQLILDSLAWKSDSALYSLLPESSPNAPTPASVPAGRVSVLQLFFRKVLSLAASRIHKLGTMLELDAKILNQTWTAIKECLSVQHHLMKDRHLDQIILCSIYGVCKVNHVKPEVTFKRIIDSYKKLQTPQWAAHYNWPTVIGSGRQAGDIIRNIKLDDDSRGDIIKFYNKCYIPTMKVFLLQFQLQEKQQAAADAAANKASASIATLDDSENTAAPDNCRKDAIVTASTSDAEIVAEAAANAVEKFIQTTQGPKTPNRRGPMQNRMGTLSSPPPLFGSPKASLQLFTSTEVEALPVSVQHTSPKRVLTSNIFMSPLQQARLHHRAQLTPRSHALYAFGESPSRDLALINRAVNTDRAPRPTLAVATDSTPASASGTVTPSSSTASTPNAKRRRL
ncbi:TPA: hypothetical protein N0F65_007137 [Lagenidium giganteum]|uniref:Uncharacterized protein n=1 Tax=Lagenidium giganteum TaxID=4803 RepID=A0AAV2YTV1_9STRA|nr:TPA: hypothetical protein N0F65_007137 [Lagenidium giganteum]